MNHLDLPNRCLAEIDAQEGDGSAYYTACCRPLGHAHGHMSLAVDDRKEAARRARKGPAAPGRRCKICHEPLGPPYPDDATAHGICERMDDFDWHKVGHVALEETEGTG